MPTATCHREPQVWNLVLTCVTSNHLPSSSESQFPLVCDKGPYCVGAGHSHSAQSEAGGGLGPHPSPTLTAEAIAMPPRDPRVDGTQGPSNLLPLFTLPTAISHPLKDPTR